MHNMNLFALAKLRTEELRSTAAHSHAPRAPRLIGRRRSSTRG